MSEFLLPLPFTMGMFQVGADFFLLVRPEKPLKWLAEYLAKKSAEVEGS